MFGRLGRWLRQKNIFVVTGLALVIGLGGGFVAWGGFNLTAGATSSTAFCTSCHEMRQSATEYEHSVHYRNVFGVRAQCADCHVPQPFFKRAVHMVVALRDVAGHFTGIIDTPAKYRAHKKVMAERVWAEMTADNSMGCRTCHSFQAMAFAEQPKEISATMHQAMEQGRTCVECHKGLVHTLPAGTAAAPATSPAAPPPPPAKKTPAPAAPAAVSAAPALVPPANAAPSPTAGTAAVSPGATSFPLAETSLMADAKGNPLGTVTPGTPLRIVKADGKLAEVRIDGWSMSGAEQYVFAAKGQRITLARLSAASPDNRKVTGHSQDTYGTEWQQVVITGWVPAKGLVSDVSAVWHEADALYKKRCTACHALHQPGEFTANQWPHILKIMARRAGLTAAETALVSKYLQTHAKHHGASPSNGQSANHSRR